MAVVGDGQSAASVRVLEDSGGARQEKKEGDPVFNLATMH